LGEDWPNSPITVQTNMTFSGGERISLAVSNKGNPGIAYDVDAFSTGAIKYIHASDADGQSWSNAPVLLVDSYASLGELEVINGKPAISFRHFSFPNIYNLEYMQASDADGVAWNTPVTLDSVADIVVGEQIYLEVINGNPTVAYTEDWFPGTDIKFVRSVDVDGANWKAPIYAGETNSLITDLGSLHEVKGRPAIGFASDASGVGFIRAADADGDSWTNAVVTVDAFAASEVDMAVIDGRPAFCYHRFSFFKYVRSVDSNGLNWTAVATIDAAGIGTSLQDIGGRPAVLCLSGSDLRFARGRAPAGLINWIAIGQ
jgi:hypothetical protein